MFNKIKKLFSKRFAKNEFEKDDSLSMDDQESLNTEQASIVEPQKKTVLIFNQKTRVFITKSKYSVVALFCPLKKEFHIRKLDGTLQKIKFNPLEDDEFAYPVAGDWIKNGYDGIGIYYPKTGMALLKNIIDNENHADISIDTKLQGNYIPLAGNWRGEGADTLCFYNKEKSVFLFPKKDAKPTVLRFGKKGENYFPISGDWNDEGSDSVGLYEPETSLFRLKYTLEDHKADLIFRYGKKTAMHEFVPLSGNWDGKGADSIGICEPGTGLFKLKNTATAGKADSIFKIGFEGLIPLEISMVE